MNFKTIIPAHWAVERPAFFRPFGHKHPTRPEYWIGVELFCRFTFALVLRVYRPSPFVVWYEEVHKLADMENIQYTKELDGLIDLLYTGNASPEHAGQIIRDRDRAFAGTPEVISWSRQNAVPA